MLLSALIFGILGSFHCVGMCGPIAFLLPLDRKSKSKRILQLLSYHGGRLLTYSLLGSIFGLLGKSLNLFGLQQQLSIGIGSIMIVLVLLPKTVNKKLSIAKPVYKAVGKIKNTLGQELKKKKPETFFTIGFLNGFLPCGLVYMAIFGAIATGSWLQGSTYMFLFGLGTVPLMTSAAYLGNFLKGNTKKLILKTVPVIVFLIGVLFILRGAGLGIKYLSPAPEVSIEQVNSNYSCH